MFPSILSGLYCTLVGIEISRVDVAVVAVEFESSGGVVDRSVTSVENAAEVPSSDTPFDVLAFTVRKLIVYQGDHHKIGPAKVTRYVFRPYWSPLNTQDRIHTPLAIQFQYQKLQGETILVIGIPPHSEAHGSPGMARDPVSRRADRGGGGGGPDQR